MSLQQRSSYSQLTRQSQPLMPVDLINSSYFRCTRNRIDNNNLGKMSSYNPTIRSPFFALQSLPDGIENNRNGGFFDSSQKAPNCNIAPKLSFEDAPDNIVEWTNPQTLLQLARDRDGIQLLTSHFPATGSHERQALYFTVLQPRAFNELIDHSSGNFLIQKMIEVSSDSELSWIENMLSTKLLELCSGSYGCRVVQRMIERIQEKFPSRLRRFIGTLAGHECNLAVAQTGSHVLQRIFLCAPFESYEFILSAFIQSNATLESIVEDKYGCRVIQLALQQMKNELMKEHGQKVEFMFSKIVGIMKQKPLYFISHQYANYIMQDLLSLEMESLAGGSAYDCLGRGNDRTKRAIVTITTLSNLLSLSQEKHASHVVEKAFMVAPERVLCAMMDEIFDGYEADRDGNDALHVLMFDQYGNYVVQTMIDVALEVKKGIRKGKIEWYNRLVERVSLLQNRLVNFSSGKRILSKLAEAGALPPFDTGNMTVPSSIPAKFR